MAHAVGHQFGDEQANIGHQPLVDLSLDGEEGVAGPGSRLWAGLELDADRLVGALEPLGKGGPAARSRMDAHVHTWSVPRRIPAKRARITLTDGPRRGCRPRSARRHPGG